MAGPGFLEHALSEILLLTVIALVGLVAYACEREGERVERRAKHLNRDYA